MRFQAIPEFPEHWKPGGSPWQTYVKHKVEWRNIRPKVSRVSQSPEVCTCHLRHCDYISGAIPAFPGPASFTGGELIGSEFVGSGLPLSLFLLAGSIGMLFDIESVRFEDPRQPFSCATHRSHAMPLSWQREALCLFVSLITFTSASSTRMSTFPSSTIKACQPTATFRKDRLHSSIAWARSFKKGFIITVQ
jgi:hypothetical protein